MGLAGFAVESGLIYSPITIRHLIRHLKGLIITVLHLNNRLIQPFLRAITSFVLSLLLDLLHQHVGDLWFAGLKKFTFEPRHPLGRARGF